LVFRSGCALSFGADHEAEISIKAAQFSRAQRPAEPLRL
jgi:hypothetical protein